VLCMLQDAADTSHCVASGDVWLQRRCAVIIGTNRHKHSEYFVLTKSNHIVLEKLTVAELIKIFLVSNVTRMFIIVFKKAHHCSLS
jgi:predicted transcriptional regulator